MECQSGLSGRDLTAHAIPPQHIAPGPGRLLAQEGDRAGAVPLLLGDPCVCTGLASSLCLCNGREATPRLHRSS